MKDINFNDFNISSEIKEAIKEIGFEKPTEIQKLTIPQALKGKDIIGQAQTGTGKTLAFSIPIIQKIFIPDNSPQAIILAPTRELSIQIANEIKRLSSKMKKIKILPVYGGQPIGKQIRVLKKGVHIVIGTPGRILDHIERGTLDLIGIETVVLDEADEMLDMGFREDIENILKNIPKQRQTMLFSATFPPAIEKITKFYQNNPKHFKISKKQLTVPEIKQYYVETRRKDKFSVLTRLLESYDVKSALIFCNTKKMVDKLAHDLIKKGYSADSIHGDMKQVVRDKVMNKFRNGNIDILVASDLAARGIDISKIDYVFNYDICQNPEDYIHRIGRTARAGKQGYAFSLVDKNEIYYLKNIEKLTKKKIEKKELPTLKEIEEIKLNKILKEVKTIIDEDNLDEYLKIVKKAMGKDYSSLEIAAAILKMVKK